MCFTVGDLVDTFLTRGILMPSHLILFHKDKRETKEKQIQP